MSQTVQASASAGDEQQARTHGGQVQDVENGRKNSAEAKQDPATIKQKKRQAGLLAHLNKQVATTHADILLLACCLISGLADSTIYNAYGTFVSMQTGRYLPLSTSAFNTDSTFFAQATQSSSASVAQPASRHPRTQSLTAGQNLSYQSPASALGAFLSRTSLASPDRSVEARSQHLFSYRRC